MDDNGKILTKMEALGGLDGVMSRYQTQPWLLDEFTQLLDQVYKPVTSREAGRLLAMLQSDPTVCTYGVDAELRFIAERAMNDGFTENLIVVYAPPAWRLHLLDRLAKAQERAQKRELCGRW